MNKNTTATNKRIAYVAVTEVRDGPMGYYLGLAREGESGYYVCEPGFGPYKTYDAADADAEIMNKRLGLSSKEAALIVLSTMRKAVKGGSR